MNNGGEWGFQDKRDGVKRGWMGITRRGKGIEYDGGEGPLQNGLSQLLASPTRLMVESPPYRDTNGMLIKTLLKLASYFINSLIILYKLANYTL